MPGACHNNGTCTDKVGGFECQCPAGFVGPRCEGDINECLSNPCSHIGTQDCVQLVNDYKCNCKPGKKIFSNLARHFRNLFLLSSLAKCLKLCAQVIWDVTVKRNRTFAKALPVKTVEYVHRRKLVTPASVPLDITGKIVSFPAPIAIPVLA